MGSANRAARVSGVMAALALTGLAIAFVDRRFADFAHSVLQRPAASVWITRIAAAWPMNASALIALAIIGIRRAFGLRPAGASRTILALASAILLATAVVVVLKWGFGRLWPETWVAHNPSWIADRRFGFFPMHGGIGYESFPSGHTARMSAAATVLWQRAPRGRLIWLVLPLLVAAGLLAADFHFVSDCMAGALVGVLCGWVCARAP